MEIKRLNEAQLKDALVKLGSSESVLLLSDKVYELYDVVCDGIEEVLTKGEFKEYNSINPLVILLYILNEFIYYVRVNNIPQLKYRELLNDDNFFSFIASIVCDKYLTNEQLNYKSEAFLNKFNPQISTLSLYLNFCLNILNKNLQFDKYNRLIKDMLRNSFSLAQCIENLLINGFDVEAFSTWRTMHENECIIYCLLKNGAQMVESYLKHIEYSLAYRGQIEDKNKVDEIFVEIKANMKKYDLKSKDMKKFIEYGYLFEAKGLTFNEDFKLNFRDGVEKVAGLSNYSKTYELSSEIAHSSPFLIYSNRQYYFSITMINLYETFFRLEEVFYELFKKTSSEEEVARYNQLRNVYKRQLQVIYKQIGESFRCNFSKAQRRDNKSLQ